MGDLMEYPGTYRLLHTSAFFDNRPPGSLPGPMFSAVAYPPFAATVLAPIYLSPTPVWAFLYLAATWLAIAFWQTRHVLVRVGLSEVTAALLPLSMMLVSFPIERLVHQGNIELLVWTFTTTGIWAFLRGKHDAAAMLWGLAAALKLYPILLLLLCLSKRSYRALFLGAGVFVGASWLSLWWLGPTLAIAWRGSLHNVFGYQSLRISEWSLRELVANHSFFGWWKLGALIAHMPLNRLTVPYYGVMMAFVCWAFLIRLRTMPVANQLLAVTVCMLGLPSVSYYHTLVHLYAPLLLLVLLAIQAQRAAVHIRGLQTTMVLFIPLFAPYTLLTFPHVFLFCGMLQAIVLAFLFLCALEFPFAMPIAPEAEVHPCF
ncbi:MAG: glycosyltransferase family 87 protein [Janthinobacterium lividum]